MTAVLTAAQTVVRAPSPQWSVTLLQAILLVLVALGAMAVVLARQHIAQVILLSVYGIVLTVLFLALQAPDVALSELSVGTVVLPLLLLLGLAKIRDRGRAPDGTE